MTTTANPQTVEQAVKQAEKPADKPVERKLEKHTHEYYNDERVIVLPKDTDKARHIPVTLLDDQAAAVLNVDTMAIVSKMYTAQDDIANESKFVRTFIHTAVLAGAKQECRRLVGVWENAITKENKLHPTWSRTQAETELLQSRKMQELKALVDVAVSLLKTEFK